MRVQEGRAAIRKHVLLNNPLNYTDPDGHCPICIAVWVGIEVGLAAYDAYDTAKTLLSSQSSITEKKLAVGGFLVGLALPGGGYGRLLRVVHEFGEKALQHAAASSKVFANALQGGKHFGFLAEYATRSVGEIQFGIKSLGKQIAAHQDKINNQEKYVKNWNKLTSERQAQIKKIWQKQMERQKEQKEILEKLKVLKEVQAK
ncbi:MAG TPA: hypothetical protein VNN62_16645 [Methylomirabilota bacterium]|jgi:hypothetical protein|uniref:hypothetical protein n=1 Tax=Roseiflexus sp. TaxID=2562120 RepID=UPI0025F440DB|nr:hypothetical protein [Roseiflexus sp.]MCL6543338.1 hypothetical protein [Roseiflexus sp.]HXG20690.1 hypothetical protein [Methylomirabilota bacterium]